MSDANTSAQAERTFLHDLCNSLAVAQGSLHLLIAKLKRKPEDVPAADIQVKLTKALESIDKMNELIMNRRAVLKNES